MKTILSFYKLKFNLGPPNDYTAGCAFIEQMYKAVNKQELRACFVHKTCATDTRDMDVVFNVCFGIILERNIAVLGYD